MTIKVYSKPGCEGCRLAKDILDEYQVPYRVIDVSIDSEARDYLINTLGAKSVPVIEDSYGVLIAPPAGVVREFAQFHTDIDFTPYELIHDYVWEDDE